MENKISSYCQVCELFMEHQCEGKNACCDKFDPTIQIGIRRR